MKVKIKDFSVRKGAKLHLAKRPTDIDPLYDDDEDFDRRLEKMKCKIADLQEKLHAEGRHSVLVVLQGMDASGKDGIVKHTMSCLNPLGVHVTAFGRPSSDELLHDFLWRTHAALPRRGKIGIFNRSYYEEVLTVRAHAETLESQRLPPEYSKAPHIWKHRLSDIANYEAYLKRQGYEIIKFFLHVSQETQRKRLLERLNDPNKNYKVDLKDMDERALWTSYRQYYEDCMEATSSKDAPWYLIPADNKQNARLMVSHILLNRLEAMPLKLPEVPKETKKQFEKMKIALSKMAHKSDS